MSDTNVVDLSEHRILKTLEQALGLTPENSNVVEALKNSSDIAAVIVQLNINVARERAARGEEPFPCFNRVCTNWIHDHDTGRMDYCAQGVECNDCMYQVLAGPPSRLNYEEYMPTHLEALDMLELHGLLKGDRQAYAEANARYNFPATQNLRKDTEVKGITMHHISECVVAAIQDLIDNPYVHSEDKDSLESHRDVLGQNTCLEVEKAMGIYPNVVRLTV